MDDRIKIAEWMGRNPGFYAPNYDIPIFNPFTDANDCEAVIRKLNELGHPVTVRHGPQFRMVQIVIFGKLKKWVGDDWKEGVCKLALKVIDQ